MVLVRDARPEDSTEVAGLHIRAWQAAYRGLLPGDYLDALRVEERAARYSFGSLDAGEPRAIVATEDGVIRGFASAGRSRDRDTSHIGELYALYIDPPRWGTGVGGLLMSNALDSLRALGFDEAILWLLVGNNRAERFYRADGWWADGTSRVEDVWGVEASVVRYRRELSSAPHAPGSRS
jgi:GNAT superfamily N-acetyltransferase